MAHIFKYPTKENKGIIVFTHKEWPWLLNNATPVIKDLKNQYYLGWNQGTFFGQINLPGIVDFALTSPNMMSFPDNGKTLNIPLCDRNFLLSDFKNLNIPEKYFDVIAVSRATKIKYMPDLLKNIRKCYDKGNKFQTLIVIPISEGEKLTPEKYDRDIVETYNDLFTPEERKTVTLLRLSEELGYLGISPQTINWFYNNSKVLYIGSKSEGTCRVVHEALLGGCHIVYYKDHKGGLIDYLDKNNSVCYDNHDSIDIALSKAVKNYEYSKEKTDKHDFILSENHTQEKLSPYFKKLYKQNNQVYDGELINMNNLSLRLPAHYDGVPWTDNSQATTDILTIERLTNFINYLNEQNN